LADPPARVRFRFDNTVAALSQKNFFDVVLMGSVPLVN
jgi:hypothetical protein